MMWAVVKQRQKGRCDMTTMDNPIDFAVASRDSETLDMVTEAVKHGQAMLAYQPVVRSDPDHQIAFFEGLIRVTDSTGRVIPARDFMHVIENRELGREIDTLTLRLGLDALRQVPGLRLSLNMSARSIGYAPWLNVLEESFVKDDTIGSRLILEISEGSAMLVPELVVDFMDRLQTKGISFALDNFGSGYTALRYFKDFFFDIIIWIIFHLFNFVCRVAASARPPHGLTFSMGGPLDLPRLAPDRSARVYP